MFDTVLEIIFEIIFEGMTASLGSKKVPLAVRIIIAVILLLFFISFSSLILYVGMASDNKILTAIGIFVIISYILLIKSKIKKYKALRKKR